MSVTKARAHAVKDNNITFSTLFLHYSRGHPDFTTIIYYECPGCSGQVNCAPGGKPLAVSWQSVVALASVAWDLLGCQALLWSYVGGSATPVFQRWSPADTHRSILHGDSHHWRIAPFTWKVISDGTTRLALDRMISNAVHIPRVIVSNH